MRVLMMGILIVFCFLACGDKTEDKSDSSVSLDVSGQPDIPISPDVLVGDSGGSNPTVKGSACVPTCTTDADCPTKGFSGFTFTCKDGLCTQNWCAKSSDCTVPVFPTCIENGFARQCMPKACGSAACTAGEDCAVIFPGYKGCVPAGMPVSCTKDADCKEPDFPPGHTRCIDGYCGCETDSACQTAKTGAGLDGTWKCVAWPGSFKEL